MKILWPHNFSPEILNSGIFMHDLFKAINNLGVTAELQYLGNLRNFRSFIGIKEVLYNKAKNYNIIHSQFGSLCGFLCSHLPGIKILSLRGSDFYGCVSGNLFNKTHGKLQKYFTISSMPKYDGIIVMSHRMEKEVCKHIDKKIRCIPCGIDLDLFSPINKIEARKILNEEHDNDPWVLFPSINVNNPVKRYKLAEAAYLHAKKRIPNLKFKNTNNINHKDMPTLINASDVVLMTSTHEGWPNSIKESLACNIPFVSTDVSDLKYISKQEDNCFVVDDAAELIGNAIVDSIKIGRNNNLRKYANDFDLKKIALKTIEFYEFLLKNK